MPKEAFTSTVIIVIRYTNKIQFVKKNWLLWYGNTNGFPVAVAYLVKLKKYQTMTIVSGCGILNNHKTGNLWLQQVANNIICNPFKRLIQYKRIDLNLL